jgi:hypothetical protein
MKLDLVKRIIREEISKFINENKVNEARISNNTIPLNDLIYEVNSQDIINLKVYDTYNSEWVWIKSYTGGSKIWCGDDPNPSSEEGWSYNVNTLVVDLNDDDTNEFLEDIGYL